VRFARLVRLYDESYSSLTLPVTGVSSAPEVAVIATLPALFLASTLAAAEPCLVVFDLSAEKVPAHAAEIATAALRAEIERVGRMRVLSGEETSRRLREKTGQDFVVVSGPEDAAKIGAEIGCDVAVVGTVKAEGKRIAVAATAVRVEGGSVLGRADAAAASGSEQALREACSEVALQIAAAVSRKGKPGEGPRKERRERGGPVGIGLLVGAEALGGCLGMDAHVRLGRFAILATGAVRRQGLTIWSTNAEGERFKEHQFEGENDIAVGGGILWYFTGRRQKILHQGLEIRGNYGFDAEAVQGTLGYHFDLYPLRWAAFTGSVGVGYGSPVSKGFWERQFDEQNRVEYRHEYCSKHRFVLHASLGLRFYPFGW
jgi:TolB-like protein